MTTNLKAARGIVACFGGNVSVKDYRERTPQYLWVVLEDRRQPYTKRQLPIGGTKQEKNERLIDSLFFRVPRGFY